MIDLSEEIRGYVEQGIHAITADEVLTRAPLNKRQGLSRRSLLGAAIGVIVLAIALTATLLLEQPSAVQAIPTSQIAIRDAEHVPGVFSNVTRASAKEMTLGQFKSAAITADQVKSTVADTALVWVVAVAGTVHPQFDLLDSKFTWGVVVFDAQTGHDVALLAGSQGTWPPYFDALPDVSNG